MKMKYDSIELKAGDIVEAKTDAEYRNLSGRGGQVYDEAAEKKDSAAKEKARKDADKKAKEEKAARAKADKEAEKASKDAKKPVESKEEKTLDKE